MIDWYSVGFSALWIIGLGLLVTALSFANYLASQLKRRFWQVLEIPSCRIMIDIGLVFFSLGWTGMVSRIFERITWAVLSLIFIIQTLQHGKKGNPCI